MTTTEIKPVYATPSGDLLIPQKDIEAEVQHWANRGVIRAFKTLLSHIKLAGGEPCPCCRRPLEAALEGRFYNTNMPTHTEHLTD